MTSLFLPELLLKSTAVLCLAGAGAWMLRGRSAAWRHAVWTLALGTLLLLPLVQATGVGFAVVEVPAAAPHGPLGRGVDAPAGAAASPGVTVAADGVASAGETATAARFAGETMTAGTVLPAETVAAATRGPRATSGRQERPQPWLVAFLATVWSVGVLAILGRLLLEASRLRGVVQRGRPPGGRAWRETVAVCARALDPAAPPRLVLSPEIVLPIAWGSRPGTIVLPVEAERWSASRRRAVLLHELAHLRRRDWLTGWIAELARAVYWPHPLAWWALARCRGEAERACDDLVVRGGVGRGSYARDLLDLAASARRPTAVGGALALARRRGLASRVSAILDGGTPRDVPGRRDLALLATSGLLVAATVGCARLESPDANGAPVHELVAELSEAESRARQRAAWALGEREDPRAVPGLVARLGDPDPGVRLVVAWALGEIKDVAAIAPLLDALDDGDALVREAAVRALGEIEDPRAARPLAVLAGNPAVPPALRAAALWSLGEIGSEEALAAVARGLEDGSPDVRVAAVEALPPGSASHGVDALRAVVADGNARVRRAVACRLGSADAGTEAVEPLLRLLADRDPSIRAEAAWGLGRIRDPRAVDGLIDRLRDADPGVRSAATWALDEIES